MSNTSAELDLNEQFEHVVPSPEMKVIRRDEIPTLTSVVVEGKVHNLGILKDFRKHPDLAAFIPEQARLSMSWVRLTPDEVLETHTHTTKSMIVMAAGKGLVTGDIEDSMEAGDIVIIPEGYHHGFIGAGVDGLWALSIQFEGLGLYEDPAHGRVQFKDRSEEKDLESKSPSFRLLLERNERFAQEHLKNPIFELIASGRLSEKRSRNRFFDSVQVWSGHFQRALLARSAFAEDPRYVPIFLEHLTEEFGHDAKLADDRAHELAEVWDPVLEAASNWFVWKMLSLDNAEKIVLIHLVLEVGGSLISGPVSEALGAYKETDFFEIHAVADEEHQEAGVPLLANIDEASYDSLFRVQKEGWDMLNLLLDRIAELTYEV